MRKKPERSAEFCLSELLLLFLSEGRNSGFLSFFFVSSSKKKREKKRKEKKMASEQLKPGQKNEQMH